MVTIQPQVAGQITEIHFTDGAEIKKGDPLFTIDPRPYQAQLDQAQANLVQAKVSLDFAKLELSRVEAFFKSRAISQEDYDTKKNAVEVGLAQVQAAEAAIEIAKLNLEYCEIRSPIDGRAGQRLVDVGNIVKANEANLLLIQRLDPIYADFTITESELANVRRHMAAGTLTVEVRLPDEPEGKHEGDLTFLDNAVKEGSGTVNLRATLPNADRHFWPGQFVRVQLVLNTQKDAVLIPAEAIQIGQRGSFVYVVKDDGTADMRPVTLGQRQNDLIVVDQGVQAGEEVITSGQMAVAPGGKVAIADETVKPPATSPSTDTAPGNTGKQEASKS